MVVVDKIANFFSSLFTLLGEREKNRSIIYYQKQIKRLRWLKNQAQSAFEVDDLMNEANTPEQRKKLEEKFAYYKRRFRQKD
jgi:Spy/CpxP family protein refolding chaperone